VTSSSSTTSLCLDCGLCCDGTMHSTVALEHGDDREVLLRTGFHLLLFEAEARFEQPCHAFHERCTIYDDRPTLCRSYRCSLLRQVDSGEVSDADARALVTTAIDLRDRVRPAIEALVGSTKTHSFAVLVCRMDDALEAMDPAERAATHAQLELDAAELLTLLADRFEPRTALTPT
jgi:Fe-S-cluster containining protein